ncbi:N-acetylglucosamine-specific PTS transporter subunit IIBC [Hydrogenibacillus sp. N12]|uniref:N-acetylglucosamine-specific PTS transporter subunit IIBC n=1 Tax=Hydrogenibacillus sp. N12 TaxID=2866627 RepID=UPI001C7D0B51|nr:N-acetylglucosamine-specific PTS transporter subunit IIBC [Hydrogenibacillus sp. N12]QZA33686.1 N-acetylglucosamine-specific PTS transporter subunit IIBC [Hydrogenibacillus sp. N12]
MLAFLQRIGRALMLPIAVLPIAGLLLRFGQPDLLNIPFIAAAGGSIFDQLPLLFAIGVAVGLAKDNNGAAALAGAVAYFVLTKGAGTINESINMSVLGGILSGVVAGLLYNRFKDTKLPDWLGFFGGRRFVPIITGLAMIVLAFIFGYIWPPIQSGIYAIGEWITTAGAIGVGLYGVLNRLLIPLGLHHVINSLVWFVFGEYNGATGDLHRFFAGDPSAGFFMAGFFPVMMFGLPGAALAMWAAARKDRRKAVAGMLFSVAFTAFLTGITEPIEFAFMFLSPVLYFVHALLTGLSMMIAYWLDIHHGFTFSAGAIDFFLNMGIARHPWELLGVGVVYGVVYFVVFYALIVKLNLKTPGREDTDITAESDRETGERRYRELAQGYLTALGGKGNIAALDNCITRLRLTLHDAGQVDEEALKRLGARGMVKLSDKELQVIVGTDVEFVANEMRALIKGEASDDD